MCGCDPSETRRLWGELLDRAVARAALLQDLGDELGNVFGLADARVSRCSSLSRLQASHLAPGLLVAGRPSAVAVDDIDAVRQAVRLEARAGEPHRAQANVDTDHLAVRQCRAETS